ncbi:hypothetical protein [Benzoatithermus flavus]|uniref:Uncharacterized protein n=1 Tax=Benzoatithermus flavus TaxID=3108223 RepID=A0ABU8XPU8_9PROT
MTGKDEKPKRAGPPEPKLQPPRKEPARAGKLAGRLQALSRKLLGKHYAGKYRSGGH